MLQNFEVFIFEMHNVTQKCGRFFRATPPWTHLRRSQNVPNCFVSLSRRYFYLTEQLLAIYLIAIATAACGYSYTCIYRPKVSSRDLRNFSQSLGQSNMPPPVGTPSCGTNEGTLSFHPSMGVASPAAAAVASFHTMRRSSYNKTSANSGSSGHGAGVGGSVFEPGQCLIFLIFHFPSMFHQEKEKNWSVMYLFYAQKIPERTQNGREFFVQASWFVGYAWTLKMFRSSLKLFSKFPFKMFDGGVQKRA